MENSSESGNRVNEADFRDRYSAEYSASRVVLTEVGAFVRCSDRPSRRMDRWAALRKSSPIRRAISQSGCTAVLVRCSYFREPAISVSRQFQCGKIEASSMVAARPVDPTIYLDFSLCKRPSSRAEGALHRAGSLTIYTLKSKYGGTDVSDAPRLLPGQLDQCFPQASGGRSQLGQGSSESGVPKNGWSLQA